MDVASPPVSTPADAPVAPTASAPAAPTQKVVPPLPELPTATTPGLKDLNASSRSKKTTPGPGQFEKVVPVGVASAAAGASHHDSPRTSKFVLQALRARGITCVQVAEFTVLPRRMAGDAGHRDGGHTVSSHMLMKLLEKSGVDVTSGVVQAALQAATSEDNDTVNVGSNPGNIMLKVPYTPRACASGVPYPAQRLARWLPVLTANWCCHCW